MRTFLASICLLFAISFGSIGGALSGFLCGMFCYATVSLIIGAGERGEK